MDVIRRYWRFALFFWVLIGGSGLLLLVGVELLPALLGGFDAAALAFIVALVWTLSDDRAEEMRRRAAENEPDHHILQLIAAVVLSVVVAAVGLELRAASGDGLVLAGGTLLLAWLFGNLLFALHYAHSYYLDNDAGGDAEGLDFPGDEVPVYWDFAYFSFVLGMTFQVSDVDITASKLRRVALIHSIIAFLFNIGVIALTVSLIGNALK